MSGVDFRLFDGLHHGLERALDMRRNQHVLVTSNLANADTPGYRAKELPFEEILGSEIRAAEQGVDSQWQSRVTEREPLPWALDGNSVDAEHESVKLTENSMLYNALTTVVSKRLTMLKFAASDGRG
jgi:flagellar basal-body rod protein FlgB